MKFVRSISIHSLPLMLMLASCGNVQTGGKGTETNDFFDNLETTNLPLEEISIGGEVSGGGSLDLTALPLHSVTVKELRLTESGEEFIGAFRYDGYSLHDIVSAFPLDKKNKTDFRPPVDAYIEVENAAGEKAVFSWGEVFFPTRRHRILIAGRVMPVNPQKTEQEWLCPEHSKLVVAGDYYAERNIDRPVKITIRSHPIEMEIFKGRNPLLSPDITLYGPGGMVDRLEDMPQEWEKHVLAGIFYGRGRGLHSTDPLEGVYLKDWLMQHFPPHPTALRQGLLVVAAKDGYRATYSYSEVCNRNDHSEVLFRKVKEGEEGGVFRLLASGDFFADRSVFSLTGIWYSE